MGVGTTVYSEGKETYQSHRGSREILDLGSISSIVPGKLPGELASPKARGLSQQTSVC